MDRGLACTTHLPASAARFAPEKTLTYLQGEGGRGPTWVGGARLWVPGARLKSIRKAAEPGRRFCHAVEPERYFSGGKFRLQQGGCKGPLGHRCVAADGPN